MSQNMCTHCGVTPEDVATGRISNSCPMAAGATHDFADSQGYEGEDNGFIRGRNPTT